MVLTEINRIVRATISIGGRELMISLAVRLILSGFFSFMGFFSFFALGSFAFFSFFSFLALNLSFFSFLGLSDVSSVFTPDSVTSSSISIKLSILSMLSS